MRGVFRTSGHGSSAQGGSLLGRVLSRAPDWAKFQGRLLAAARAPRRLRRVTGEVPNAVVVLVDEAVVAGRGEQVVVWFVRLGAGWVRATEHPQARVAEARADRQDEYCPPGTIWRRTITLELERGSLLRKTTSRPLSKRMSPMEHLMSGSLEKRRELREVHYRVLQSGRIARVTE